MNCGTAAQEPRCAEGEATVRPPTSLATGHDTRTGAWRRLHSATRGHLAFPLPTLWLREAEEEATDRPLTSPAINAQLEVAHGPDSAPPLETTNAHCTKHVMPWSPPAQVRTAL